MHSRRQRCCWRAAGASRGTCSIVSLQGARARIRRESRALPPRSAHLVLTHFWTLNTGSRAAHRPATLRGLHSVVEDTCQCARVVCEVGCRAMHGECLDTSHPVLATPRPSPGSRRPRPITLPLAPPPRILCVCSFHVSTTEALSRARQGRALDPARRCSSPPALQPPTSSLPLPVRFLFSAFCFVPGALALWAASGRGWA